MPNLPHRAARTVTAASETCLMTLIMLPAFLAHAIVNAPWTLYQAIIRRKLRDTHTRCPGCPYCEVILAVRLPKDIHH